MTKLNKTVKERHQQPANCQARDASTDINEENGTGTNPLFSCKLLRLKASYHCARHPHRGTSHVSALCVEDPSSPPSTSTIDANHSSSSFDGHRRQSSDSPDDVTDRCLPSERITATQFSQFYPFSALAFSFPSRDKRENETLTRASQRKNVHRCGTRPTTHQKQAACTHLAMPNPPTTPARTSQAILGPWRREPENDIHNFPDQSSWGFVD